MAHVRKQAQAIIDLIAASNLNQMELLRMKHEIEEKMIKSEISSGGRGRGPKRELFEGERWHELNDAGPHGHRFPRDLSVGSSRPTSHGQRHQDVGPRLHPRRQPPDADGINAIGDQIDDMSYLNSRSARTADEHE